MNSEWRAKAIEKRYFIRDKGIISDLASVHSIRDRYSHFTNQFASFTNRDKRVEIKYKIKEENKNTN